MRFVTLSRIRRYFPVRLKNNKNPTLADLCNSRDNNFNLLRFGAASAVFVSHCPGVAGLDVISITTLLGYVAVNAFFAISGFLVAKSLYMRNNMAHFLGSRALRIYPALIVAVIYTALVVGLFFSSLSGAEYIHHPLTRDYLSRNLLQLFWPIPVSLPGLAWSKVNAPLWTLPFELHMYLLLTVTAALAFALKGAPARIIWILYFLCTALATGLYMADYAWGLGGYDLGHKRYYLRFLSMFGIGVALFLLRGKVVLKTRYVITIMVLVILCSPVRPLFVLTAYGSLAYVLLYLAYIPGGFLRQFNKLGDYSYGIYIFGYPTQKAVMQVFPAVSVIELFLISFSITLCIAALSWHLIERPALSLKRKW